MKKILKIENRMSNEISLTFRKPSLSRLFHKTLKSRIFMIIKLRKK